MGVFLEEVRIWIMNRNAFFEKTSVTISEG